MRSVAGRVRPGGAMAVIVSSVVGFFAIVALVAYLRKRHYHEPDLGGRDPDPK